MRINKQIVDRLVHAILDDRFAEEEAVFFDNRAALADKVYEDVFSEKDRELMESLPEGWLPTSASLFVSFGGQRTELKFNGAPIPEDHLVHGSGRFVRRDTVSRRVPSNKSHRSFSSTVKLYPHESKLGEEWAEMAASQREFHERVKKADGMIRSVIGGCRTSATMIKAWPEVEPYLTALGTREPVLLPSVRVEELNEMLLLGG